MDKHLSLDTNDNVSAKSQDTGMRKQEQNRHKILSKRPFSPVTENIRN